MVAPAGCGRPGRTAARLPRLPDGSPARRALAARADLATAAGGRRTARGGRLRRPRRRRRQRDGSDHEPIDEKKGAGRGTRAVAPASIPPSRARRCSPARCSPRRTTCGRDGRRALRPTGATRTRRWTRLEPALGELDGGRDRGLRLGHGRGVGGAALAAAAGRRARGDRRRLPRHPHARRGAPAAGAASTCASSRPTPTRSSRPRRTPRCCGSRRPRTRGCAPATCARVAEAAHAAGALLAVDNTLATPLGHAPLALGADFAVISATKLLERPLGPPARRGQRARRRAGRRAARAGARSAGAIPGAVRGLAGAPLARHARAAARAQERQRAGARRARSRGRDDVTDVRHPGLDDPVAAAPDAPLRPARRLLAARRPSAAQAFLDALPAGRRGDELRRRRTRPPSGAGAGAPTPWPRASSASRPAARTPPTSLADVARALDVTK